MADIDTSLIGTIISSIPYDQAFGAPLAAAIDAQSKERRIARSTWLILEVGFEEGEDGKKKTREVTFVINDTDHNGTVSQRSITVPTLLLTNIPQIEINTFDITFDLEISQNATQKETASFDGSLEAKVGWGPFSLGLTAKGSYGKEQTRKTDTRAKQHVELHAKQAEPPEAVNIILEMLRDASLGPAAGKRPALPSGGSSGGGSPEPAPAPKPAPAK